MKIIKDEPATLKRGRRITVELAPGETLLNIREGTYYRLGGQIDDIVQSHLKNGQVVERLLLPPDVGR